MTSRRFTIPTESGTCMVPFADMANHTHHNNMTNTYTGKSFKYSALRDIK
jgi:hypothetical protein